MANAGCLPYENILILAGATAYETRRVSSVFNEYAARLNEIAKAARFVFVVAWEIAPGLKRIAESQAELIRTLETSKKDTWDGECCRILATMLSDLIKEEGNFLNHGFDYMKPAYFFVGKHLSTLRLQTRQLEDILVHIEALSLPERNMSGDSGCREFMEALTAPEEFDFSCEPDTRRVASLV